LDDNSLSNPSWSSVVEMCSYFSCLRFNVRLCVGSPCNFHQNKRIRRNKEKNTISLSPKDFSCRRKVQKRNVVCYTPVFCAWDDIQELRLRYLPGCFCFDIIIIIIIIIDGDLSHVPRTTYGFIGILLSSVKNLPVFLFIFYFNATRLHTTRGGSRKQELGHLLSIYVVSRIFTR